MALTLTSVRFYTQADPYIYSVDNRPLQDLETRDNELATELEKRTVLALDVNGSAAPTYNYVPGGWGVTSGGGPGDYIITHNLDNPNYVVTCNIIDVNGGFVDIYDMSANNFRIIARDVNGTPAHRRFHMMVVFYQT